MNKVIKSIASEIEEAIENGYALRGVTSDGKFTNKGGITNHEACIDRPEDLPEFATGVAVMVELVPSLIVLDIDTKDEDIKNRLRDYIDKKFGDNQFIRVGTKEKLYQIWGQTESKTKFRKALDLEIINQFNERKRVNALGLHKSTGEMLLWPKRKFWEVPVEDLPFFSDDFINDIIDICGVAREQHQGFDRDSGRHNRLVSYCGGKISDGKYATEIIEELMDFDRENHNPPYFTDKSEGHGGNGIVSAMELYASVAKNAIRGGQHIPDQSIPKIEITDLEPVRAKRTRLPKLRGIAQEMFRYIYDNADVPRSRMAFASSISCMSVILGNKIRYGNILPNMYTLMIMPSGYGKNFPIKFPQRLLAESNASNLLGEGSPSSDTALLAPLQDQRVRIDCVDEADVLFSALNNKQNAYATKMADVYTALYSTAGEYFAGKKLARFISDKNPRGEVGACWCPYVSFLGAMTPKAFQDSFRPETIEKGFGGRILYFYDDKFKRNSKKIRKEPIPEHVKMYTQLWTRPTNAIDFNQSDKVIVPEAGATKTAEKRISEAIDYFEDLKEKTDKNSLMLPIYNRMNETLVKMALIDSASQAEGRDIEIKADNVDWAFKFCESYCEMTEPFIEGNIYSSATDSLSKKMTAYITERGVVSKSEITSSFKHVIKPIRDGALRDLIEAEIIGEFEDNNSQTKKRRLYKRI